ncbi:MAG: carbohydrate ABC transporter permease [Anaerolineae bacterium]
MPPVLEFAEPLPARRFIGETVRAGDREMVEGKTWGSKLFEVFNHTFLIMVAVACLLPMIHILAVSLSSRAASVGGFVTVWPIGFTVANYQKIFESRTIYQAALISVQRTVLGTAINLFLTALTAYPLSKTAQAWKGRNLFMWIVVFSMLFNGGLIPWFLVIRSLGLLNSIWALILPGALPVWNVILTMNFFRDIPRELEEAAIIDGANHWRILWNVYVPISVPALATMTLFSAVGHWNSWFDGMVLMSKPDLYPLQTFLRGVVMASDVSTMLTMDTRTMFEISNRSARAATILISTIPILVVYPFVQRYFIVGIKLGAIKG